jgi:hypothetical protein
MAEGEILRRKENLPHPFNSLSFDGEKFMGRLPQINISSHLYDMFGKDYIGVGKDSISKLSKSNCIAMNMKATEI